MSLQELAKFTIISKYAKYLPNEQRRETWQETVERCRDMHLRKYDYLNKEHLDKINEVFEAVNRKECAPSMRSLQFGGEAIERKNARMYNCSVIHIHNPRAIQKAFWLLLCGCGVGLGFAQKYVKQFPKLSQEPKTKTLEYVIEDTIEGWADSIRVLIDSYLDNTEYSNTEIFFDYTQIRKQGAPLSIGGKAPGPKGLAQCHRLVRKLIEARLEEGSLRSIDLYDIMMHCSDAVLSGGIRRSATIALFDLDDSLMMNAKVGNWYDTNPQRGRSNNSVVLKRGSVTKEQFKQIFNATKQFGEPGFVFVNDEDTLFNPCAEIGFIPVVDGKPAVQFCNLSIVNGNKVQTKEDLMKAVEYATIIGTLQAGYTDFPYLDKEDEEITKQEALLGVSILGFMSNPEILLNPEILREASALAVKVNEEWAERLGINKASRVTCVKPDGNSAAALESPFSGIHPAHSFNYYRRVQVNKDENLYQHFKNTNPHLCEPSIYSANGTDDVITFPISVGNGITKDDLSALEHLEDIKLVQDNWVNGGQKNNRKDVSNSVSCTVLVRENEWELVSDYLFDNQEHFSTVSLLPSNGDKIYQQAPYEAVKTEEETQKFFTTLETFRNVDYTRLKEADDYTVRNEELGCVGGVCSL